MISSEQEPEYTLFMNEAGWSLADMCIMIGIVNASSLAEFYAHE
jgi:hypothetical protein